MDDVLYVRIPKPIAAILIVIRAIKGVIIGMIRMDAGRKEAEAMVRMLGRDGKEIRIFKGRGRADDIPGKDRPCIGCNGKRCDPCLLDRERRW